MRECSHRDRSLEMSTTVSTTAELTFRGFIKIVVESAIFDRLIMITILTNAVIIALGTFKNVGISQRFYEVADVCFLCIYSAEFILKVTSEKWEYFGNSYNRFDFFILGVSLLEFVQDFFGVKLFANVTALRVFRG